MNLKCTTILTALVAAACAAPAGAVVNGEPIDPAAVPQFATLNSCGGTLVAPDRVLTAAHCVAGRTLADVSYVNVGGVVRAATRYAMHPGWQRTNGRNNVLDDVAVLALDQPVNDITPAALGGPAAGVARVVGRGRPTVPGSGASESETYDGVLRQASLRLISDAQCARAYRVRRGNGGERFYARMRCAVDVDGRAPLSSGCNGDSGGPLLGGTPTAPVVLGVVSWGGSRCGADRLPNVFAEVGRYRAFINDRTPTWAPTTATPATISGTPRVGSRLRCSTSGFAARPDEIAVTWQRQGGRSTPNVGHRDAYTVTRADAGHLLVCSVRAANAGGYSYAPFDAHASKVKVPR